jgi:N-acylneuraminate cytidylyltransferase
MDMHNVAFIPVRGGSKSIPLKNIKPICGKPLVYWTLKAACGCRYIDQVYVATDSDKIRETVEGFKIGDEAELFSKAVVIDRSPESAADTASTEFAMLEFARNYEFDNIALIQATSPLLTAEDLDGGFSVFHGRDTDSVLSVVRQKRFNWEIDKNGFASPTNYDVFHRPRRQEFDGYLVENGAFYITSRARLLETKNRLSGNIRAYEMDESTYVEIDEPGDWNIVEMQMKLRNIELHP